MELLAVLSSDKRRSRTNLPTRPVRRLRHPLMEEQSRQGSCLSSERQHRRPAARAGSLAVQLDYCSYFVLMCTRLIVILSNILYLNGECSHGAVLKVRFSIIDNLTR